MTLNKEIAEYRKIFFDLYYKDVLPRLSYYDKERKDTLFVCSIIVAITLITLIPAVMFFINSEKFRVFAPLLLLWSVPLGVASFKSYCFITNLKESFYDKILPILGIICLLLAFMTIQMFREENKKWRADLELKICKYSSNQVEGRYLITTAFMERLVHLQNIFGTKKIKCAFVDDVIIFAIPTNKNVFEIGNIFRPLTRVETMERFFSEISAIYLLIDHFKLNEKTGL